MEINAVIEKIEVESKAKAKADPVFYATMKVGDYHRQGDVYIMRIDKPNETTIKAMKIRAQIAPGTTQGSRHCISGATLKHIRMYEKNISTALDGPVLECFKQTEITHPEHGHVGLPAGWYAITFQRQLADELRRVAD